MNKRTGFFKRTGQPVILTVGRSNQVVRTGDVIHADFNAMMEKEGWQFLPKFDPAKEKMEVQKTQTAPPATNPSNQMIQVTGMERREIKVPPRHPVTSSERMINEKIDSMLVESKAIKLSTIEQDERAWKKEPPAEEVVVNFDKLAELKKLGNKDWFAISKEDCVKYLKEAGMDFSHIKNEKWELVKFLKSIIKDIPGE